MQNSVPFKLKWPKGTVVVTLHNSNRKGPVQSFHDKLRDLRLEVRFHREERSNNKKLHQSLLLNTFAVLERQILEDHFAQLISQEKIAEADYNLSVSTYVEKEDTREKIDIDVLNKEIAETVKNIDRLRTEIDKIVEELS